MGLKWPGVPTQYLLPITNHSTINFVFMYYFLLIKLDEASSSEVLSSDLEKVQSTLKQIVRDWSTDGEKERELCYTPIIEEIERLFPSDKV